MSDSAQLVDLQKKIEFDESRYAKIDVASSEHLLVGLNTFLPGQTQSVHAHEGQDKFYLVLGGRALFTLGEQRREVGEGVCVWAPAGVDHGVENKTEQPLVVLVGIAPAPGS